MSTLALLEGIEDNEEDRFLTNRELLYNQKYVELTP